MKIKRFMMAFLMFVMLLGVLPAMVYAGECPAEDSERNGGNHFWNVVSATDPTCTAAGSMTSQCVYCGATMTEQTGGALGHSWSDWSVTSQPTCTANGTRSRSCGRCGQTETESIVATGHNWGGWTVTIAATCATAGTQTRTCAVCGTSESQSIPATGNHSWSGWSQTKAAACTAGGEEMHTCSVCGKTETRSTAALGHSWGNWQVTKKASCVAEGTETRTCSRCGEKETRSVSKTAHSWSNWRTTRTATCTAEGKEERTCSVCGKNETRSIQKTPHTYGAWSIEKEATCTEEGRQTRVCVNCGHTDAQNISKLPHTYGEWKVTLEPTCTEEGEHTHICEVCGFEETTSIEKIPHTFGEWTVTLEPTCTAEGEQTHTCEVCGLEETEAIPMIPHDFGEWEEISPLTDYSIGIRERTCKVCGFLEHEEREPAGTWHNGDRGEGVRQLQQTLNDAGYDAGTADGIFGPKTENAIKDAQQNLDKSPDGVGWPGVLKDLMEGENFSMELELTVKLVSEPDWYGEGETATFEAEIKNASGQDLTDFTIYQRSRNSDEMSEWYGLYEYKEPLAAGESITIPDLSYTVSAKDEACEDVLVSFYVSAVTDITLYSNQEDLGLLTVAPGPDINLIADRVAVMPFSEDAEFTVPLTLISYSETPILFDELETWDAGDEVSQEAWMTQPLVMGEKYHFTYTGKLSAWEAGTDWAFRTLTAVVHDQETGKKGYSSTHAFVVHQYDGPAVMLFADDTTGMGGDVGDEVYLTLYAVNNGTVDQKVTEIGDYYYDDYAIYNHAYDTLFAAGDSFLIEFCVKVLPWDAFAAGDKNDPTFWRQIHLWADLLDETGGTAAQEFVHLWFSGPLPGLTLTMTQITTPDQEVWSPDESGQVATLEYDCVLKNTGERTLLLDGLYVYLYPSTEAGDTVVKFEDIVLEPGESHSFKAELPINTGNISPGSASETIDGVIQAEFMATALDPETGMQIAMTDVSDNTFTYKVKLDAYSWAPPTPGEDIEPAMPIPEDADEEEALDNSLYVTKKVTSRSQLQTKPTESGDFYAEGERVTYEIYLDNLGSETLYDMEVIDRIGGTETMLTKIPSLEPGEEHIVEFEYYASLADAQNDIIQNTAWATYRVGNSDERVRSYEGTAYINVIGVPVGDGEVSSDLNVKKSHTGTASASNGFFAEGDVIHYEIQVTNTSDHIIENISVTDPLSGSDSIGTIAVLEPGASSFSLFDYEVTAQDVEKEAIKNVARAEWTWENEKQFANSNVDVASTAAPVLEIVKYVANSPQQPGGFQEDEIIHYEITVTNISKAEVGNLEVIDYKKQDDPLVDTIPGLNPGGSASVAFDYTVTKADVEAGEVVNQASVLLHRNNYSAGIEQSVNSNELHTPTLHGQAEVSVTKSEETSSPDPAGYALYETSQGLISVRNDSDKPLTDVYIYDMANGDTTGFYMGTIPQVDPGQELYWAWGLTVTPEDVARGYMTNAARAEFIDPYTGEPRTEYAPEITIPVKQPDTVYGGLEVTKSVTNTPANGSFFVEGEEIAFHIEVKNLTGQKVKDVTVYEALVPGGILKEVPELADGDSISGLDVLWTVTALDVANGEVNNVVTVHATGEDGTGYIAMSNPAIALTGEGGSSFLEQIEKNPGTPEKAETPEEPGQPENPGTPGEPGQPGAPEEPEQPGTPEEPEQPGTPEEPGQPGTLEQPGTSEKPGEPELSGTSGTTLTPGTAQTSETIQIWGGAELQSETNQNEYCKRVLTGKGDGSAEYEMVYCAEHVKTVDAVRTLLEQAETEAETLEAWQQSIELWTEALNAEYDELFTEATDMEKPLILEERTLFYLQLTCYQDDLAARYADDPVMAAAKISEQLMNKTADVCYETHTAPENRIDSYVTGRYTGLADITPADTCLRDVKGADTGAKYQENLCEQHRITEEAVGALLYDAADNEALANAWKSAIQLWLVELDAITNERYLAADAETKTQIAAERVSFGNWLNARAAFLKALYPDKPEIVNEVVTQAIRSRVLDLCGENES